METYERKELMNIISKLVTWGLVDYIHARRKDNKDGYLCNWADEAPLEDNGLEYTCGESKGVIIASSVDWVIKFTIPNEDRDMCAREYENYVLAKEAGLAYYFAEMKFLTAIGGINFYAQEMVECDESVDNSLSEKLARHYESIGEKPEEGVEWELLDEVENMSAVERVDLLYGDAELCRFIEDRHINDLHCGNFGIAGDRYVMIDYSGFGSQVFMDKPE